MNKIKIQSGGPERDSQDKQSPLLIPGGLFIVIEGIDGTGKSTQVGLLAEKLRQLGYFVVETREPTDGKYGRKIRQLFVNRTSVSPEEELNLFLEDRAQHVREVIKPSLAEGYIVISDRYYLSTVAYQGANGMDPDMILAKNAGFPEPDLAIILELEPHQGIQRIRKQRQEHPNSFEEEDNLQKVAEIFTEMPWDYIKRVNGAGTMEQVHDRIFQEVIKFLSLKLSTTPEKLT